MPPAPSAYYHSLRPFRRLFETGFPILIYHKLGPAPRGARLKGLHLSRRLFERQLSELTREGFGSAALSHWNDPISTPNYQFAITFDDGFRNVLEVGLEPLAKYKCKAIQFLVADRLGGVNEWDVAEGETPAPLMNEGEVRTWLGAGHEIGSHTLTHPWLTRIPPAAAREEISASRKKLEDRFRVPIEHFCYPYGDWNESVSDLVVAAGYKTACTTQPGMNAATDSPFALKRFTARYRSRNLKAIWSRIRGV